MHEPQRPPRKSIVRASALVAALGLFARKERHAAHPEIVRTGPEVDAVVALADALADDGRDDENAVRQLRAAAKGRRRVLERALAYSRMGPGDAPSLSDFRAGDLQERLLVAAATDQPLQPVSAEQAAWFLEIDALYAGGTDAAYARLKARVPGVEVLEHEVRARAASFDDDWWESVYDRLELLFRAPQVTEPVLRSGAAFAIAHEYLGELAGAFNE